GQGGGKLVVRVDNVELVGRWNAPALTPNSLVAMPVDLAAGLRKLTVELVDARGVASKPVTARINVTKAAAAAGATLHVLAVGVTDYRDSDLKLKYAAADARDVAERLALRGAAQFNGRVVKRTLTDKEATLANIGRAVIEMAARARPDDTFVLYMAGHGTTLDEQYYFLPYDLDYVNDNSIRQEALSQARLRTWLSLLPVRSLLLLDTCRAGNAVQLASRAGEEKGAFSTLMRLTNRAVIVASSQNNMALEGYQGHGVFSWVLLDAIDHADYDENGTVDVTDIATHVRRHVPDITERVFKYRQVPMQDTPGDPFAVAVPLPKGK
ncbi:MAG TPA: caspase family protein, partial [Ideonella sp.]|nr:caspase family protein [Ideonella sp.]